MASLDLGKQIGPLPLGAWIVVVGGGLGIAYYTRRDSGPPVEVEDTGSDPGVGTGAVGGWTPTTPGEQAPVAGAPTTNEEWAVQATRFLIASNYDPINADSAVRNYVSGSSLSVSETALIAVALARFGPPPQVLPPGTPSTPPESDGPPEYLNVAKGFVWQLIPAYLTMKRGGLWSLQKIEALNPGIKQSYVYNGRVTSLIRIRVK